MEFAVVTARMAKPDGYHGESCPVMADKPQQMRPAVTRNKTWKHLPSEKKKKKTDNTKMTE